VTEPGLPETLAPEALDDEQRDRVHRAQTVAQIVVLGDPGRRSGHPLSREPDAVSLPPRGGVVVLLYPGDVVYAYDEVERTVTETITDPLSGERSSRTYDRAAAGDVDDDLE
jgi:hypothetical protein